MPLLTFDQLRKQIIGRDFFFKTPYGTRLLTYADYTASGRSIQFIEKYLIKIQREYANTHTEDDLTGRHMTDLLHKAEETIKKAFNAEKNCYFIAAGTGTTGAITRFQEILGVRLPPATKNRIETLLNKDKKITPQQKEQFLSIYNKLEKNRPVVFIGAYEHHSNDIQWRQAFVDVVEINLDSSGYFDLEDLEKKVSDPKYKNRMKIGSFSAASNVTGLISPVYDIARIMHKYGGIAGFDFAASAPYVEIDMNKDKECYFDAIYLSPHKFVGGPGSTGVLIINKNLYDSSIEPTVAAGGTVDYVSSEAIVYTKDVETREKPGTPGILQIIKAALAIDIKNAVGINEIEELEQKYTFKAIKRLRKNLNLYILGSNNPYDRLAIISFLTVHDDKFLHPKFFTKLLNDLFGIQSRAGCMCSGPYGHRLLDIEIEKSEEYQVLVRKGKFGLKPGWTRLNFHYLFSETELKFICDAVDFIATNGYKFIPLYMFNCDSGEWFHKKFTPDEDVVVPTVKSVLSMELKDCFEEKKIHRKELFAQYLEEAKQIADTLDSNPKFRPFKDPDCEKLRWFYFSSIMNE